MDFANPHFAEPQWLWLAVTGPLALLALQIYASWKRRQQLAQIAHHDHLAGLLKSHSAFRRSVKNLLLLLIMAGLGLTLARPQWGERLEETQAFGEDVLFLLDTSRSMLATDVRPNRLQRAKLAMLDFVQRHGSGRVGLLAFAGEAFLQCPLTFDYEAFRESLLAADEKSIPVPGTDLGRALDEAYLAMEKNQRRKIMILVSDGEDLQKSGVAMAKTLAEKGVVVYTVGVGTPLGSHIPAANERGQIDTIRDADGNVVLSRLDETTLQTIANTTGGRYQIMGPTGEGLTQIRRFVEALPDSASASPKRKLGIDHFHFPLAVGTLLLVWESLIGTRRSRRSAGSKLISAQPVIRKIISGTP
jgi:Ca-activated chloride channel homolog